MDEFNNGYKAGIYFMEKENGDLLVASLNIVGLRKITLIHC
jgi:hypothetical protein